jgi:aspartyl-tRNA(Asn)/glutamyl-tRNA(Gln) amidotransferase subunit C
MEVTEALVRDVARLARLELTDAEVAAMVPTLARILHHVEAISKVDVAGVDPAGAVPVGFDALRDDVPAPGLDRRAALANAPAHDQVFFLVPKVLEGGG